MKSNKQVGCMFLNAFIIEIDMASYYLYINYSCSDLNASVDLYINSILKQS